MNFTFFSCTVSSNIQEEEEEGSPRKAQAGELEPIG